MAKPGHVAWFALDSAAGSLVNLQPYLDNTSVAQSVDTPEVSALGTAAKAFVVGMNSGQITISGPYAAGLHTHIGSCLAAQAAGTASHSFLYGPGGSVASEAKISGECIVTGYTPSAAVGGRVEWTASLQVTGAIANATF